MAKSTGFQAPQAKYAYPSFFGTHACMVEKDNGDGTVVCQDEFGKYTTEKKRIDNGAADPNRYPESRLGKLFAGAKKKDEK